jgi:transcriptional regulator with XRE-family HTH domain
MGETEIAKHIRAGMKRLGIDRQITLADRAGISAATLSNILTKGATPTPGTCIQLSQALLEDWTILYTLAGYLDTPNTPEAHRRHGHELLDRLNDQQYEMVLQYIKMVIVADAQNLD